jgi:hypothetical protein
MKAATNPTTTSIQFWTSKPRKVKPSTRNRTAADPVFRQAKHFCDENILFLYFDRAGTTLPMQVRSGAGDNSSLEGNMRDEEVSSARGLFWLALYGDERPDMSR